MEFNVSLSSIDIIRAIVYAQSRNKSIWAMSILSGIFVNTFRIIGLWAMEFPLYETAHLAIVLVIWIFGLFAVGLLLTILMLVCNPMWRKGRIGIHRITISEKGITESTDFNRSEIYWPSVRNISTKST